MVSFPHSIPDRSRVQRSFHDHDHDHEWHGRRSTRRDGRKETHERRVEIELVDLDAVRDSIKIGIKSTSRLSHITNFLKRRYKDEEDSIPDDAQIFFYWTDKYLSGDEIPTGVSLLRYRVLDDDEDDDDNSVEISSSSQVQLEPAQVHKIRCDLDAGKTIGALRRSIASYLDVEDPNRVVISARGGMRPGLLQGNSWDASKLKTWLCRAIFIHLVPESNYFVLRGVNEEYVYHPPPLGNDPSLDFRTLRDWLRGRILTGVHRRVSSRIDVEDDDITLSYKGRMLTRRSGVVPGQTVDFELTRRVEDRFVEEEAWLLPLSENCVVCGDDKRVSEMPRRITKSCEHEPNTCKECVGQWITSSMDTLAWDRLRCPECPELLRFGDVRAFATCEVFARYDTLAMKAAVTNIRDFKWCLNPRCGSGLIHRANCSKVKCPDCRASSCAHHNVPWHRGETCEQYDRRTRKQRRGNRASEKKIKEMSKACPQCHRDVHKYSGCDHITCICGHEWCYICLATYYRDRNSFLQCQHKQDCKYLQNPPNYEGGRAFMPFLNAANRGGFPRPGPPPPHFGPPPMFPNRIPRRPVGRRPPVHADNPMPAGNRANADPFQFMMEDFFAGRNPVDFDANDMRRGQVNDFLGAAAIFTIDQLAQRAR